MRAGLIWCLYVMLCLPAAAVDPSALWLAAKHEKYYVQLVKSADAAESIERCVKVIEATLDVARTTKDRPIFRILCRQRNGVTYNEMVDGLTFATLTTPPKPDTPSPEEIERERLRVVSVKTALWRTCEGAFPSHVELMRDLQVLTTEQPEPIEFSEERVETEEAILLEASAKYCIDFDARGAMGERLYYRAHCQVSTATEPSIQIKKRPAGEVAP